MKPLALALIATFALAGPAQAAPGATHYANRLAANARSASVEDNCLVLRSIDLCGYRVRLVARSVRLGAEAGGCHDHGCWYELTGKTRTTKFFCRGYMAFYSHAKRWYADQSISCYADNDPSWYFNEDGVLIRSY